MFYQTGDKRSPNTFTKQNLAMGGHTTLLSSLSCLILKTSKDEDCTASQGKLVQRLLDRTHGEKAFPFLPIEAVLVSIYAHCLLCCPLPCTALKNLSPSS